jgi:LacI family transcriptional regulator
MATILDIAKKAGVSTYTVSRALNGHSDISEQTRARIRKLAEELNYYPNAAARSLQGKRTNTIALALWPRDRHDQGTTETFFQEFIGKLAIASLKYDLSLLITQPESQAATAKVYRELAGSGRVDGLILTDVTPQDTRIELLNEIGLPFVAYGRTSDYANLSYPFVDIDGRAGSKTIFEYLYQQGHRRIAYLSVPFYNFTVIDRFEGYKQTLQAKNLELEPDLVHLDLSDNNTIENAVAQLVKLPSASLPTAIMTNSDQVALNVIYELQKENITPGSKPGQIAVTGFDNLVFSSLIRPSLTTVKQPLELISHQLLELLRAILDDKQADFNHKTTASPIINMLGPAQVLIEPELVQRDSA